MPVWTHYFAHFVVAVIATISFGITFQMPRRHYLACGLTGAVGWMVYIFCVELFALSPAIATLVATLPLTGCARFFAIRHKAPVTIFLLPGIFPLVPGAGIYYTAYYFLQGEQELFASKGGETFKVALALALGIALVCSLPLTLPVAAWFAPSHATEIRASSWMGFVYVSLFSMWIGFFAWYRALALGAVRVSQIQLIQPFLSLLFAVPLAGERLDATTLVFALAVIATVYMGKKMPIASHPAPATTAKTTATKPA